MTPVYQGNNPASSASFRESFTLPWVYPLRGLHFFLVHPAWWPLFGRRLPILIVTSLVILGLLFFWCYLPLVALLAIFHGPAAWVNGAFILLGLGQVLIALLFEALMVDETLVDVFDAILIHEGFTDLVAPFRVLHHEAPNAVKMLGKPTSTAIYAPFSCRQITEFILFLPLNFLPIVGVPAFLLITGARGGPFHHWRYFQLLGLTKKQRKHEIQRREWSYTWFGTMALILQLVPVLSMFFLLTTAAGAARWAVSLEKKRRLVDATAVADENAPPAYADNPA